jgi:S1-C subfamily serine protease
MKRLFVYLLLLLVFNSEANSQSLSKERVEKIKKCTVKITIHGSNSSGTGFFVDSLGSVLTCFHVIQPALKFKNGHIVDMDSIYIHTSDSKIFKVNLPLFFIKNNNLVEAFDYDYCLLTPVKQFKTDFLKIGNYDNALEGQEVVTCGYPFGINQQFISRGVLSTKYVDSIPDGRNPKVFVKRNVSLLNLTLNKGNSGGAIIIIGKTMNEDRVIGIADFILIPFAQALDSLSNNLSQSQVDANFGGVSTMQTFKLFDNALSYVSNGVSGCISINYFKSKLSLPYSQYK